MYVNIPTEIEFLIYNYLILPLDISRLKCLSKYHNKIVESIEFIKKKKILQNRAYMCIEDKECYNKNLSEEWEEYSKIYWPFVNNKEKDYTPLWKVGEYVDVLDKIQVWGSAKIIDMELITYTNSINKKQTDRRYRVQFLGWDKHYNESVSPDKITFLGSKTINPNNKFTSLCGNHKRWVLFFKNDKWGMEILTIKSFKKNEKIIQVVGFYDNELFLDTITPDNINSKIRSVSDSTVLLSFLTRRFDENRLLLH